MDHNPIIKRFFVNITSKSELNTEAIMDKDLSALQKYLNGTIPSIEIVEEKKAMDANDITFTVTVDDTITGLGHAKFDPETKVLSCYVPPHVNVVAINKDLVASYYDIKEVTYYADFYSLHGVFQIEINESLKPCCNWYSPSEGEIRDGAEQVPHYPFNKARKVPSCSNPDYTGSKHVYLPCTHPDSPASCTYSRLSDWEPIALAYHGDNKMIAVERKMFARRIPSYRVVTTDGNELVAPTSDLIEAREAFEKTAAENDYHVVRPENAKKSYFKAVLSTN